MRRWFEEFSRKISIWMYGRYGTDELNRFLMIAALVCMVLSCLLNSLTSIALFFILCSVFRTCSKNTVARQKELALYLQIKSKTKNYFEIKKDSFEYRKTYKYYRCRKCKANLRVPRGKGKIEITCNRCGHKFIKET